MSRGSDNPTQWSKHALVAELERSILFSQATTMSQNAELIRQLADGLGATSPLADLLSAEADRVIFSMERVGRTSRQTGTPR